MASNEFKQRVIDIAESLEHTYEQQAFLQLELINDDIECRKGAKSRLFRTNFFEDIDSHRRQYLDRVLCQCMRSLGQQIKNNLRNDARDDDSFNSRMSREDNSLLLVDLKNKANFTFDKNGVIQLKSVKDVKFTAKSTPVQPLYLHIIAKSLKLIEDNSYVTKRELYYLSLEFCRFKSRTQTSATHSTSKLDNAINGLCCLLGVSPVHLHIIPQSKGLVYGDLSFKLKSGEVFHCLSRKEGVSIPTAQNAILEVTSSAKLILIVEKDSVMQMILGHESSSNFVQNYKAILFTAKGYPDIASKAFINLIWSKLKIPVLALTDADPHGLEIVCSYKFGSYTSAHEGIHCVLPNLRWLGLLPTEVMRLPQIKSQVCLLSPTDLKKIESLLKRPYLRTRKPWIDQIELMRDLGRKAELESLDTDGTFLVQTYLPTKLRYASWL